MQSDLAHHGFGCDEIIPVMVRKESGGIEIPHLANDVQVRITEVATDNDIALFHHVRDVASDRHPQLSPGIDVDARVLAPCYRLWIGWRGDEPVATAGAYDDGDYVLIKNIATLPSARGLGIGAAMTVHAMNACERPAVFDAAHRAVPLYPRLGFVEVGEARFWRAAARR